MLARKLLGFLLACLFSASSAFAADAGEPVFAGDDEFGPVAESSTVTTETVASGGEEGRTGGEDKTAEPTS